MKNFWSGFLSGITCMVLVVTLGLVGYSMVFDQNTQNIAGTVNESGKSTKGGTSEETSAAFSTVDMLSKINLLQQYIDTYYLNEPDGGKLEDGIFKGIISGLEDPYSVYYTEDEYNSIQQSTKGVYCGIGARVQQDMETGIISIILPFEDSPADEAGMLPGDIIYKVAGEEVSGKDLSEVVAKMKGEEGTSVEIVVIREEKEITMSVARREVEIPTVTSSMLDEGIGYIKVSEFDEVTAQQFREALEALEKKDQKGLIIDLRNNGGGRLTAVVDMLDRMLPEGTLVSTKEKSGKGETYTSSDKEKFEKPLAVLINGSSASASEVFAGAIQDYGTGKLVGVKSFGKGIVQTIFGLQDGTALKLTTSEYFTPKGRNIHGEGLMPDVEVELDEKVKKKIAITPEEDNQLQEAVRVLLEEIK